MKNCNFSKDIDEIMQKKKGVLITVTVRQQVSKFVNVFCRQTNFSSQALNPRLFLF